MDQPRVTVYRTASCPFCIEAVRLLRSLGVEPEEVPLDDHPDRRVATEAILPGHRTVPLIVVGDRPVGGYQDLRELLDDGGVEALLGVARKR